MARILLIFSIAPSIYVLCIFVSLGGGSQATYYYVIHNGTTPVVSSVSATLTIANMDQGSDTTSCTQSYSRMLDDDGVQDCDAGHILAHRLGGPGNQPINIFPQVRNAIVLVLSLHYVMCILLF